MSGEYEVECPHEDCAEALILTWHLSYTLSPDETVAPVQSEAHCETWQVECAAGHVILLPGPPGCPCEPNLSTRPTDPDDCPHNYDDFDWSDETSIFRDRDLARLQLVVARLRDDRSPTPGDPALRAGQEPTTTWGDPPPSPAVPS